MKAKRKKQYRRWFIYYPSIPNYNYFCTVTSSPAFLFHSIITKVMKGLLNKYAISSLFSRLGMLVLESRWIPFCPTNISYAASKNKVPLLTQSKIVVSQLLRGPAATKSTNTLESDLSTFRTVVFPLQQHLCMIGIVRDQSNLVLGTVHICDRSSLYLSMVTAPAWCSEWNPSCCSISIKNGFHEVSSRDERSVSLCGLKKKPGVVCLRGWSDL